MPVPKHVELDSNIGRENVFMKRTNAGNHGQNGLLRNTTHAKETAMRAGLATTSHAVPMVG